jgi:hypothetical protein
MNKTSQSTKAESEAPSAKHARPGSVAGIEAQLGNRTTGALLDSASASRGRPLEPSVQRTMESAFQEDFSSVQVHTPESVPRGVQAATTGQHIVFGRGQYAPHTERGRRLIAHELAHVVQQSGSPRGSGPSTHLERQADRAADAALAGARPFVSAASTPAMQFRIEPEDVAAEMVGQTFEVIAAHTSGNVTLAPGDHVKVDAWDADAIHSVRVTVLTGASAAQSLVVPQRILKPLAAHVAGVAPYSAGVAKQAGVVKKTEDDLAKFQATKGQFKTKKAQAGFAKEEHRREALLVKRRDVLNRKEIQEQMFNRSDAVIAKEVAAANTSHGLTGKDALDPNLFKAQLFEESELGTAGQFMSDPPTDPVSTRFNLGQVIDSSALALLTLMEREQPALIAKFNLSNIRKDLASAQKEKETLETKQNRTPAEDARLDVLRKKAHQNWETFLWQYVAPGQTLGFNDAVADLFASGNPTPKNLDYEFWIHLAVLWLFEKKKSGMSWPNAIKAYNGSGAAAAHYKRAIVRRAAGASSRQAAGKEFIPTR